jgi:hypothetical protein
MARRATSYDKGALKHINVKMKLEWMLSGLLCLCPYVQVTVYDTDRWWSLLTAPLCKCVCVCARAGGRAHAYPECNFICHFAGFHCRVCRMVFKFVIIQIFRWYASTPESWRLCCLTQPLVLVLLLCKCSCAARFVRIRPQGVMACCTRTFNCE